MRIRWYGQSAFLLSGEHTVAIDPFDPANEQFALRGLGFDYPPIGALHAELLLITHEHFDHNAAEVVVGSPTVIRSTAGTFDSPVGEVIAIAAEHDDAAGVQKGPNTIYCFSLDGLRVCHFGDFGQAELRRRQQDAIGELDLLFLPVGGGSSLNGEAAVSVIRSLRPRLVVPMHYRTDATSFLEPPEVFLAALDTLEARVERLPTSEFETSAFLGTRERPTVALPAPPLLSRSTESANPQP